jgi:hypothetical protein
MSSGFPPNPKVGDRFWYPLAELWFRYDGRRWISERAFTLTIPPA